MVAKVVDDRHIQYKGQTTSLSALAQELKQFNHPIKYKVEILNDIRLRLEKKK